MPGIIRNCHQCGQIVFAETYGEYMTIYELCEDCEEEQERAAEQEDSDDDFIADFGYGPVLVGGMGSSLSFMGARMERRPPTQSTAESRYEFVGGSSLQILTPGPPKAKAKSTTTTTARPVPVPAYPKECCGRSFHSAQAIEAHKSDKHNWCKPCDRYFTSLNAYAQHRRSAKHQPKSCTCPMRPKSFVSIAAVVSHLESGTCPSKITRAIIDDYVARNDVNNIVTNPNRLITSGNSAATRRCAAEPMPAYKSSDKAWNGSAWACPLCHIVFPYKPQLDQHLNSPKHAKRNGKMYRCPAAGCGTQAETLSELVQHVTDGFEIIQAGKPQLLLLFCRLVTLAAAAAATPHDAAQQARAGAAATGARRI